MKKNAVSRDMAIVALEQRADFYTGVSPVCASCGANSPDIQMSGLFAYFVPTRGCTH